MKYAQFCFLEKGMGLVSLTHFVYDISKKKKVFHDIFY